MFAFKYRQDGKSKIYGACVKEDEAIMGSGDQFTIPQRVSIHCCFYPVLWDRFVMHFLVINFFMFLRNI